RYHSTKKKPLKPAIQRQKIQPKKFKKPSCKDILSLLVSSNELDIEEGIKKLYYLIEK
ncbi:12036_t:CDS:1, partial [Rhizophagus irregularis]